MSLDNHDQHEILTQFRNILTKENILHDGDTIGTDDSTLLRFLRARKFNLKDAKKMFADCQEWRKTVEGIGIDELYRTLDPFDYPERNEVFKSWPIWFHKPDKNGRPLNINSFGGLNLPELYKHISPERHWQTFLVSAESLTREVLPASSKAAGRTIDQAFVIVDLKGFSLHQFWQVKALTRNSFQVSQDYFPETMGQLAIVNAPMSFTFIWSIIKPWLSKETADKVDILGSDYQEVLLRLVDKENLPASLGGACKCKGGCKYSSAGPWKENFDERGEKRKRELEASQATKQVLAVNGGPSIEQAQEVPIAAPSETQAAVEAKEHGGNGEAMASVTVVGSA
ncbi:hypothetical protein PILCRDRAFT_813304, partial [Piloderma croceum F 1598]